MLEFVAFSVSLLSILIILQANAQHEALSRKWQDVKRQFAWELQASSLSFKITLFYQLWKSHEPRAQQVIVLGNGQRWALQHEPLNHESKWGKKNRLCKAQQLDVGRIMCFYLFIAITVFCHVLVIYCMHASGRSGMIFFTHTRRWCRRRAKASERLLLEYGHVFGSISISIWSRAGKEKSEKERKVKKETAAEAAPRKIVPRNKMRAITRPQ